MSLGKKITLERYTYHIYSPSNRNHQNKFFSSSFQLIYIFTWNPKTVVFVSYLSFRAIHKLSEKHSPEFRETIRKLIFLSFIYLSAFYSNEIFSAFSKIRKISYEIIFAKNLSTRDSHVMQFPLAWMNAEERLETRHKILLHVATGMWRISKKLDNPVHNLSRIAKIFFL